MKLKGSLEKFDMKKLSVVTLILLALMLALRFWQLTSLTDPETGFFTDHSNFTVPVFYALAVGSVLGVVALAYLASGAGSGEAPHRRDLPLAASSFLFAIPLAMEGVKGLRELFATVSAYYNFKEAVSAMGGYLSVVAPVFALLSAAAMLVNGVSFAAGKPLIRKLKILILCPALWAFFLTISYFKITVSYVKVSQLMLTIFADAFLMIFLFEYARFSSGIGIRDSIHAFYGSGFAAVFLLLATEVPNLFFTLFAKERLVAECPFGLYNLLGACFVITALSYAMRATLPEATEAERDAA